MPVFTENSSSTILEHRKLRRPRNQINQPISAEADPNPQIPSIIQSTRCKSTISSLFLSTFSSANETTPTPANTSTNTTTKKKLNNFTQTTFRGFGCTAAASQQVSVPAVIRTSADWEGKKVRKKKQAKKKNNTMKISNDNKAHLHGGGGTVDGTNTNSNSGTCLVIQDVWCGPGIGFSADSVGSVDCVVARRNVSGRGKIDGEKMNQRERSCLARRTVNHETLSFLDSDSAFLTRPESDVFGPRYYRHARHPSPEGLAEIMMLQNSLLMGGRLDSHDRYSDWRLDVDDMSYEELLELGDRIGYVSTGLKEDDMGQCLRKIKLSILNDLSSHLPTHVDNKCSICQEEYEQDDEMGKLDCGHSFHIQCIKQWLGQKNTCPVCKTEVVARS